MPDTPSPPPRPRRLRGAPLNNLNALKHGFCASSLSESIEVLRVLSLAAASLTRMARTQKYLEGSGGLGALEELNIALEEVRKEYEKEGVQI